MPNWCENSLRIYADKEAQQKILAECVSKDEYGHDRLDFEKIVPIGDVPDWYNQRMEKWGVKWNSTDCYINEPDNVSLDMDFMTAWEPPIPIVTALCKKYQCDIKLEYYELGMAFRGVTETVWIDGEVCASDESWNMTDDDYRELGLLDDDEVQAA